MPDFIVPDFEIAFSPNFRKIILNFYPAFFGDFHEPQNSDQIEPPIR